MMFNQPFTIYLLHINSQLKTDTMFDKFMEEQIDEEEPFVQYKIQGSTAYTKGQFSPYSPNLSPFDAFPQPYDYSLDRQLQKNNAGMFKKSAVLYISHCLAQPFDESKLFQDGNIFSFRNNGDVDSEDEAWVESLINSNQLLNAWKKKMLLQNFKEYLELKGLFSQLKAHFGKFIAQELIFILSNIFQLKIQAYRQLQKKETDDLIPKMQRFWGDDGIQNMLPGGWEIYEELSYEDVTKFAAADMDSLANQLYFAKQIKFLNFTQVCQQLKPNMNLLQKFTTLLTFFCQNVFLTLSGMGQSDQDFEEYSQILNISSKTKGVVQQDQLNKRVKLQ